MSNSWAFLVGGGALTLAGSSAGAWFQARTQRKSVHDDRVWERRAEVYVELLGLADIARTDARARAFASPEVRGLCEMIVAAQEAVLTGTRSLQPEAEEIPEDLIAKISAAKDLGHRLETRVRWELQIRDVGEGGWFGKAWSVVLTVAGGALRLIGGWFRKARTVVLAVAGGAFRR